MEYEKLPRQEVYYKGYGGYIIIPVCCFCGKEHQHGIGFPREPHLGELGSWSPHCKFEFYDHDYVLVYTGKLWPTKAKEQNAIKRQLKERGLTSQIFPKEEDNNDIEDQG